MLRLPFQDRADAGYRLGAELVRRKLAGDIIVLALPRGGVPVGAEVADALGAPLDVIVVRKLGVPWQPEFAMGAIVGSTRILDEQIVRDLRISREAVEAVIARETQEMKRRERLYRSGVAAHDLRGRSVVLVDDGLATGSTMTVAARHVRSLNPKTLIIAVPVASPEACRRLRIEADECICLAVPESFRAVGEWYRDFREVTDGEVQEILRHSSRMVPSA